MLSAEKAKKISEILIKLDQNVEQGKAEEGLSTIAFANGAEAKEFIQQAQAAAPPPSKPEHLSMTDNDAEMPAAQPDPVETQQSQEEKEQEEAEEEEAYSENSDRSLTRVELNMNTTNE